MPNAEDVVAGGDKTLLVSFGSSVVARGEMVPIELGPPGIWRGGSAPNKPGKELMIEWDDGC